MAAITLEHVCKTYPSRVRALHELNLQIADGELLVVIGPSGSGKTTLLRLIAGLEEPTSGTIRIGCRDTANVPPRDREVALVFQRPALFPHRNVYQNLIFGWQLRHGASRLRRLFWRCCRPGRWSELIHQEQVVAERVKTTAQSLGLENVLYSRPFELSGGEQQRVALGRAMVRQPSAFLFDEPLSHLDLPLREEMRRELHLLHGRLQATMIYVTHDQSEAFALGDRIAVLKDGVLQQAARPATVYRKPGNRFVAGFLGWPPMNFVDGEIVRDHEQLSFAVSGGAVAIPSDLAIEYANVVGRPVTLGIRPEVVKCCEVPHTEGSLEMEVARVESLGGTWLAELQRGDWRITAQTMEQPMVHAGQKLMIALDWRNVHLFDRTSGVNLCAGAPRTG